LNDQSVEDELIRYSRRDTSALLAQDAKFVMDFINRVFSGAVPVETLQIHHEFFYYVGSSTGQRYALIYDEDTDTYNIDFDWAQVTNATFRNLTSLPADIHAKQWWMTGWMHFKVKLINKMGENLDERLGTPEEVVNWHFDNLTLSYDEVAHLLSLPHDAKDNATAMKISYIRERVRFASHLRESKHFQRSPELIKWIELFEADDRRRKEFFRQKRK